MELDNLHAKKKLYNNTSIRCTCHHDSLRLVEMSFNIQMCQALSKRTKIAQMCLQVIP